MERAVIVDGINVVSCKAIKKFDRVYIGNEFCQNMIPSLSEFKRQISLIDKPFSFVSPYVTNNGLVRLRKIFYYLEKNFKRCEIVINDFGVLHCVHHEFNTFTIVLGRVLAHNVFNFFHLTAVIKAYNSTIVNILKKYNVDRCEFSIHRRPRRLDRSFPFKASIYYPYFPITTTRRCCVGLRDRERYDINFFSCRHPCRNMVFETKNPVIKDTIYFKGNTMFLKYGDLPKNLGVISRCIYQPLTEVIPQDKLSPLQT